MSEHQICDKGTCTNPAVTWIPETSRFLCSDHAPVDAVVTP